MANFTKLSAWKVAHELTLRVYRTTESLPAAERFGLTSQLRRSASSIAANIAEGSGRNTDPEFARFVRIALGSANEAHYHLILAHDLGLLTQSQVEELIREVRRVRAMLASLHRALSRQRPLAR